MWLPVLLFTIAVVAACLFLVLDQNRRNIMEHWVEYRCHPMIMPFAWFFGHSTLENFQNCTMSSFNTYAGFLFEPFHFVTAVISDILGDMTDSIDDLRAMTTEMRAGYLGIVGDVFGKIQNTAAETLTLFQRMQDILHRLVAVLYTVAYTGTTVAQTGQSFMNGPIGQVINYFCFDPSTPIQLADGTFREMHEVRLGSKLVDGSRVTSVLWFTYLGTPMYSLDGVVVSGNHLVLHNGAWKPVCDHPDAVPEEWFGGDTLVCLNTSSNQIHVGNHVFRDFEEVSGPAVVAELQRLSGMPVTGSYDTGLDPDTRLADGTRLKDVGLDHPALPDGTQILGIAYHDARRSTWVAGPSGTLALADTAFAGAAGPVRGGAPRPTVSTAAVHLITDTGRFTLANGAVVIDENEGSDGAARNSLILATLNKCGP
jgi:hypothetical protein